MKLTLISDTHCRLRKIIVPESDLLLHAGDLTFQGNVQEISQELRELGRIAKNFKHGCILTPGNHDRLFENNWALAKQMCEDEGIKVLHQEGIEVEGLKIWASANSPAFCNWAFNVDRLEIAKYWAEIPDDTHVLITHGPPMGILDGVERFNGKLCEFEIEHVGCYALKERISELKQLKLHVFGHIHGGYGKLQVGDITYVNASNCTEQYRPTNPPIIVEL